MNKWHTAKEYHDEKTLEKLVETGFVARNVTGQFQDFVTLDIPASKAQGKRVYKTLICLFSKAERNTMGQPSQDTSAKVLRFDTYPDEAVEVLKRFPSAWSEYQTDRKAPEQPGEADVLLELGLMPIGPKPTPLASACEASLKGPSIVPLVTETRRPRGRPRKAR